MSSAAREARRLQQLVRCAEYMIRLVGVAGPTILEPQSRHPSRLPPHKDPIL